MGYAWRRENARTALIWLAVLIAVTACRTTSAPARTDSGTGRSTSGAGTAAGGSAPGLPPDVGTLPSAACRPDLNAGWLLRENRGAGTSLVTPPTTTSANLYLDAVSATCGQVVHAAVSAPWGGYRLRVVRVGWYDGSGSRVLSQSRPFHAAPQKNAPRTGRAGTPGWHSSASVRVGPSWPPGLYLVQLMAGAEAVQAAPLVVRPPAGAPRSPVLFVVPVLTWSAYTDFGGRSLYRNWLRGGRAAIADRARQADFARPMSGPGVYAVHRYTVPTVRAVERAGADVDYAADVDVDATPSLVLGRRELVTGSHSEYVSRRIYDAFEAARDGGTNLAFLGGNGFYWQARISRDGDLRPVSVTVYRSAGEDPITATSPSSATVRWRDPPLRRPEAGLLGAQYSGLGVVMPLVVLNAPAWLGWKAGQIVPAGAAGEVDAAVKGVGPEATEVLAAGAAMRDGKEVDATVTYYAAASGAAVFDAGTVFAGCSTTNSCEVVPIPAATGRFWSDTMVRVVRAFTISRFGASHPPAPTTTWPSYRGLLRHYGPSVAGTTITAGE